jgi:Tol biopolymer transport system component
MGGLYLVDLKTKEEQYLTPGHILSEYEGFSWSPVTQKLVYTEEIGMNESELYLVSLDGQKVRLTDNEVEDSKAFWSPDAGSIAFHSRRRSDNLLNAYLMASNGSNVRPVFEDEAILGGDFAWAPDGKKLAIITIPVSHWYGSEPPAPEEYDFQVVDIKTGKSILHLSNDEHVRSQFSWSYDSSKLVYLSDVVMLDFSIALYTSMYVLDTTTEQEILIAEFEAIGTPHWSPTEDIIAFSASTSEEMDNEEMNIYLINSDGTGLERLTDGGFYRVDSWSPEGNKLAVTFIGRSPVENEIYVFDIESRTLDQVTDNDVLDGPVVWIEF